MTSLKEIGKQQERVEKKLKVGTALNEINDIISRFGGRVIGDFNKPLSCELAELKSKEALTLAEAISKEKLEKNEIQGASR